MKNPIKMDDLEGKPTIFGNIHIGIYMVFMKMHFLSPGLFQTLRKQSIFNDTSTWHVKSFVAWA